MSLSYNPTPQTPLGLTARVAPSWGGQATSGAEALWGRETMGGMAHGGFASGNRLDADLGYGLPVGSRLVGTPRVGFATSEYGRDYRLGYSLGALRTEELEFELGVDAQRRESPIFSGTEVGGADQSVLGRVTMRWWARAGGRDSAWLEYRGRFGAVRSGPAGDAERFGVRMAR